MKIFIASSTSFYGAIKAIEHILVDQGHEVHLPIGMDDEYRTWSENPTPEQMRSMLRAQTAEVQQVDAILVVNKEKNSVPNYIGASVFLEMFTAFLEGKQIFLLNPVSNNMLRDEIEAFAPIVLHNRLELLADAAFS